MPIVTVDVHDAAGCNHDDGKDDGDDTVMTMMTVMDGPLTSMRRTFAPFPVIKCPGPGSYRCESFLSEAACGECYRAAGFPDRSKQSFETLSENFPTKTRTAAD